MGKTLRFATVGPLIFLAGCATATWTRIDQPQMVGPGRSFTIEAPTGWMHAAYFKDAILLTRDGPAIQFIRVMQTSHMKAFPALKKASAPDMLPAELAELAAAELKADPSRIGLEVVESVPLQIAGHSGFRMHLRFSDEQGLRYEMAVCGFAGKEGLYTLLYHAPTLHYFQRDLPEFESIVKAFRLGGA
jgi:hypothetical protein